MFLLSGTVGGTTATTPDLSNYGVNRQDVMSSYVRQSLSFILKGLQTSGGLEVGHTVESNTFPPIVFIKVIRDNPADHQLSVQFNIVMHEFNEGHWPEYRVFPP